MDEQQQHFNLPRCSYQSWAEYCLLQNLGKKKRKKTACADNIAQQMCCKLKQQSVTEWFFFSS